MADEQGPTILEYARFHGLCTDHLAQDPLKYPCIPSPPDDASWKQDLGDILADKCLNTASLSKEKLSIPRDMAHCLDYLKIPSSAIKTEPGLDLPFRRPFARSLKFEVPLLRTDHESDCLKFRTKLDVECNGIPFEHVDEAKNQGLMWPASYYEYPLEMEERAQKEKLECTNEGGSMLKFAKGCSLADQPFDFEDVTTITYKRKKGEPMTPPLLPISPKMTPYVPSSPISRMQLLSSSKSPVAGELREMEERIAKETSQLIPPKASGDVEHSQDSEEMLMDLEESIRPFCSAMRSSYEGPTPPVSERKRTSQLKVDGPLTPRLRLGPLSATEMAERFPTNLKDAVPQLPPPLEDDLERLSNTEFETLLEDSVKPMVEEFTRSVEHEELQEADSKRMPVPKMDFTTPLPPWEKKGLSQNDTNIVMFAVDQIAPGLVQNIRKYQAWPGATKTELKLSWSPFPNTAPINVAREDLCDDGSLQSYIEDSPSDEIIGSESLIWKPEGLRILAEDKETDEEELEKGSFPERKDIDSLVRKRKLLLTEQRGNATDQNLLSEPETLMGNNALQVSESQEGRLPSDRTLVNTTISSTFFGGTFSTANALNNFMRTQGQNVKRQKVEKSQNIKPIESSTIGGEREVVDDRSAPAPDVAVPFPVPIVSSLQAKSNRFIASSNLLTQRSLTRKIKEKYPNVKLIERDLSIPLLMTRAGMSENSWTTHKFNEADLIVSPGTGIIWTTLQKIRQKSLPGQIDRNPVKERIASVALRFERLVVLVSEGRSMDTSSEELRVQNTMLSEKDNDALIELASFVSQFDAEVSISFVGGGEDELSSWFIALMRIYGMPNVEDGLLDDVTLWELFLRRAGMNAFAAQAVLAILKPREDLANTTSSVAAFHAFGLAEFVQMPADERIRLFKPVIGGKRLLTRVNETIDSKWRPD